MSADAPGRPEHQLLLCVAQGPSADTALLEDLLQQNLDWALVLQTARAHALAPLLEWHLRRKGFPNIPAFVQEELRQRFRDNALHSLLLGGELVRLGRLLASHNIRALPFKGPTLAALAYGNLALREFVDLDLLLAPADLPRARKLLEEAGYHSALPLAAAQEDAYRATIGQMPFVRDHPRILVELHARLMPRDFHFPLNLERLWPQRQPVVVAGQEVCTLGPEDLLLVLCAHAAKHGWGRLGWVADVATLLRTSPALDWTELRRRARGLSAQRILALGVLLAHELLQAPLSEDVLQEARSSGPVLALAARVTREMFQPRDGRPQGFQEALFQFRLRERPGDGLRYALSLALAPTVADWTAVRLPQMLAVFYPLFRPIRLAAKYGRHALGRNRPDAQA